MRSRDLLFSITIYALASGCSESASGDPEGAKPFERQGAMREEQPKRESADRDPIYAAVRQIKPTDDGAASFATIARHYDQEVSLADAKQLMTQGDDRRTTFLDIYRAAEQIGFTAEGYEASYAQLSLMTLPAVVQLNSNDGDHRFAVLHHQDSQNVILADPESGIRTMSPREFKQLWTGYILEVKPAD